MTKYVCVENNTELYEKDIGYYIPLGEKKVEFTKEEINRIKDFGEPSLVLIGFKPQDRLKVYHNIRPPYFIYPDDERVENSSKFFDGLIESMLKLKKVAIARFIPRNKSKVRFVALVAQRE
jgi:ATP-dependent DNA helicase 2 subunit 1